MFNMKKTQILDISAITFLVSRWVFVTALLLRWLVQSVWNGFKIFSEVVLNNINPSTVPGSTFCQLVSRSLTNLLTALPLGRLLRHIRGV